MTRSSVLHLNHVRIRRPLMFEENEIFLINNKKMFAIILLCVMVDLLPDD